MKPFVKSFMSETETADRVREILADFHRGDSSLIGDDLFIRLKNLPDDEARFDFTFAHLRERIEKATFFVNDKYQVQMTQAEIRDKWPPMLWLSIKRLDREVIHDWRELQEIKNAIVGPEHEAVELYPAESRLVDTANQYHLFVLTDPTHRFPFGYDYRSVTDNPGGKAKQRPRNK